jgi:hypothetical protein
MQQVAEVKPSGSSAISERTFADLLSPLIEPGFRLALGMLHDRNAAEDAVQEASFTAWRKLARIQDRGRLRAWFKPGFEKSQYTQVCLALHRRSSRQLVGLDRLADRRGWLQ